MPLSLATITLFPDMFQALHYGIVGRAISQQLITLSFWNPRDYTQDVHHTVDDRPYGGGPGMVMKFEPLHAAIQAAKNDLGRMTPVIHLSPQGTPLTQAAVLTFSQCCSLIVLSSRYEGVDERLI